MKLSQAAGIASFAATAALGGCEAPNQQVLNEVEQIESATSQCPGVSSTELDGDGLGVEVIAPEGTNLLPIMDCLEGIVASSRQDIGRILQKTDGELRVSLRGDGTLRVGVYAKQN
ncbi:hypothetical protein ACFL21_00995 [Patescibacteria group bacterium]